MGPLVVVVLLGIYGAGAFKFWQGFGRTNFSDRRLQLTLMWPLLVVMNKSYRENFNRALKG